MLAGRRAAAALRRLLDLLPPRGRGGRQGHPRHLPRAPVRQGRDVQLRRARTSPGRSTSASSRSRRGSSAALEIPYRVVDIPVGDLGASASRKFDCEAWIPSQERYREVTSCSNTTDYQARRLKCRYRPAEGEPPGVVHTLNGTAVAVGRTLIALLENGQTGGWRHVVMPGVLQEFGAPGAHSHRMSERGSQARRPLRRPRDRPRGGQGSHGRRSTGSRSSARPRPARRSSADVQELQARRLHRRRRAAREGRDRGDPGHPQGAAPRPG